MKKTFFVLVIGLALTFAVGQAVFAQTSTGPTLTGYFVSVNGQATGPHDTAGLRQLINQGRLNSNSFVWKDGMPGWVAAGTVKELAPLLQAVPPPLQSSETPPPLPSQARQEANLWYNSFAPGIRDNRVFINSGVGLGPTRGYDIGIPPLSISADIKLSDKVPITLGATGILATWNRNSSFVDITYWNIGFGARAMYHFNFAKNLDIYAGAIMGYVFQTARGTSSYTVNGYSFFLFGANVGVRYFFTDSIGLYSEFGYNGLQIIGAGLTLKF